MIISAIDTIVAQATPIGKGGIGIIRVSGSLVKSITQAVIQTKLIPRQVYFGKFLDEKQKILDEGLAIYFSAPHSFTGEDVLELQGHGSPVVMDLLLQRILALGARLARPGEFSERAFLNGKIDLTQAEAIADLINSSSTQAARSALRSLQGEFSKHINFLLEKLTNLRTYVEAAIDFSDEDLAFLQHDQIEQQLQGLQVELNNIQNAAKQGVLLQEGLKVVIAGKTNVGKSSLLNRLCGYDCAIVTPVPGTTRDVLREYINLDGLPLHIIDTAGIRQSVDEIEQEGINRAWREVTQADLVLLLIDTDDCDLGPYDAFKDKIIILRNKIDLLKREPTITKFKDLDVIEISAKTGSGMEIFKTYLSKRIGFDNNLTEGSFLARRRHLEALDHTKQYIQNAFNNFIQKLAFELFAEELRLAQLSLSEITGEFYTDDLLAKIFSTFCIGK